MEVVQPVFQVLFSVPEGDDDGHLLPSLTVRGFEPASETQSGVLLLHQVQRDGLRELHTERAHWGGERRV